MERFVRCLDRERRFEALVRTDLFEMARTYLVGFVLLSVLGVGWGESVRAQTPLTPGASLPDVTGALQRLNGASVSPRQLTGRNGTVFIFWSTQCPWVERYEDRVQALVAEYEGQGIRFILVNANADETISAIRAQGKEWGETVTYVRDPEATFARALGATRTPHAYVFGPTRTLIYVGAMDDSPSAPGRMEEPYVRRAVQALVEGRTVERARQKAFGCALRYP